MKLILRENKIPMDIKEINLNLTPTYINYDILSHYHVLLIIYYLTHNIDIFKFHV